MRTIDAMKSLVKNDHENKRHVYTREELGALLGVADRELTTVITNLMDEELLVRPYRGIYAFKYSVDWGAATIYQLLQTLQKGEVFYESGMSAASDWGLISQIPQRTIYVTTGKSATYHTKFGTFQFFHSDTAEQDARANTIDRSDFDEPPLADKMLTFRDVRKIGVGIDLMREEYNKCIGGTSGTVRYFSPEDDDTWDFLDPVENKEDIEFLRTNPAIR